MNATLAILYAYASIFAFNNNLPIRITSHLEDKNHPRPKVRVFNTHKDGRALDLSVRGWSRSKMVELCKRMNKELAHFGAISYYSKKAKPCVLHRGRGLHIHLQSRR